MKYLVPLAKGEVIGAFACQSQRPVLMLLLKNYTIDKGRPLFIEWY
jgi:hypothetical protein